mmetsp:Transcript_10845/g.33250  ORF Transcript_10845/g.33250 Transcript_10845/m.33250 type:complete len:276 (+) Transcript_10845:315-1142(+)
MFCSRKLNSIRSKATVSGSKTRISTRWRAERPILAATCMQTETANLDFALASPFAFAASFEPSSVGCNNEDIDKLPRILGMVEAVVLLVAVPAPAPVSGETSERSDGVDDEEAGEAAASDEGPPDPAEVAIEMDALPAEEADAEAAASPVWRKVFVVSVQQSRMRCGCVMTLPAGNTEGRSAPGELSEAPWRLLSPGAGEPPSLNLLLLSSELFFFLLLLLNDAAADAPLVLEEEELEEADEEEGVVTDVVVDEDVAAVVDGAQSSSDGRKRPTT